MTDKQKLAAIGRWIAERAVFGALLIVCAKGLSLLGVLVLRAI